MRIIVRGIPTPRPIARAGGLEPATVAFIEATVWVADAVVEAAMPLTLRLVGCGEDKKLVSDGEELEEVRPEIARLTDACV